MYNIDKLYKVGCGLNNINLNEKEKNDYVNKLLLNKKSTYCYSVFLLMY